MADQILMPKLGNSVEECLITEWLINEGDTVAVGNVICTVETDKAAVDVEASAAGVILKILYPEGEEVPVLKPIVIVGEPGEDISSMDITVSTDISVEKITEPVSTVMTPVPGDASLKTEPVPNLSASVAHSAAASDTAGFSSPRARNLASAEGIDISLVSGTGPSGRIIERDILKISSGNAPASAAAIEKMIGSGGIRPAVGSGIGGRVLSSDITGTQVNSSMSSVSESKEISVKGVRKIISDLMLKSLTTSAQLTLNSSANAENLLRFRKRLKNSSDALDLKRISVNDLVMFAVVKTLKGYPELNAHFLGDKIIQYNNVNLGIAVDTERGLMVPVVKNVQNLSLKDFAIGNRAVYDRISSNTILPDELSGATFTVTNLGGLGIESFTPVLNIPEVAILGVNNIQLKPVKKDGEVVFVSFIGLSLTFNHQALDGAPAARFLQSLSRNIKEIDLLTAL